MHVNICSLEIITKKLKVTSKYHLAISNIYVLYVLYVLLTKSLLHNTLPVIFILMLLFISRLCDEFRFQFTIGTDIEIIL